MLILTVRILSHTGSMLKSEIYELNLDFVITDEIKRNTGATCYFFKSEII